MQCTVIDIQLWKVTKYIYSSVVLEYSIEVIVPIVFFIVMSH